VQFTSFPLTSRQVYNADLRASPVVEKGDAFAKVVLNGVNAKANQLIEATLATLVPTIFMRRRWWRVISRVDH
jgi:hypothetical protein